MTVQRINIVNFPVFADGVLDDDPVAVSGSAGAGRVDNAVARSVNFCARGGRHVYPIVKRVTKRGKAGVAIALGQDPGHWPAQDAFYRRQRFIAEPLADSYLDLKYFPLHLLLFLRGLRQ